MLEALLLGLATGPSCMLFCGPVALPLFMTEGGGISAQGQGLLRFLAGRLIGYLVAGFLLGLTGQLVLGYLNPQVKDRFMLISYFFAGLLLLGRGLALSPKNHRFCLASRKIFPKKSTLLLSGLATGINLCPPFLAMASRVLEGPLRGMLSFFFFFIGTSSYLLILLSLSFVKKRRETMEIIGRMTLLLMGGYFLVFLGLLNLGRW